MPTAYSILLAIPGKKTADSAGSLKNTLLTFVRGAQGDVGVSESLPCILKVEELRVYLQQNLGQPGKPRVPFTELRDKLCG
jgi:hypothetical protein